MELGHYQESVGLRRRARSFILPLIEQLYPQSRPVNLLDVGTGTGSLLDELAESGVPSVKLSGVDLTVRGGDWHSLSNFQTLHLSVADGLHLPFPEAIFDLAVSLGVFEHVGCTGPTLVTPKPTMREERIQFAREVLTHLSAIFAHPLSISIAGAAYTDSGTPSSWRIRRCSRVSSVTS